MGLLDDVNNSLSADAEDDGEIERTTPSPTGTTGSLGNTYRTQIRGQTVEVDGQEQTIERPETKQSNESSSGWFVGNNDEYGVPRGTEAIKQRQIVQTAAMQSIVNGIVDQLLGGELVFLDDEDTMEELSDGEREAAARFKTVLRDVLTGPHMGDEDLDDILTAAVEDMLGPGNAYIQLLESEGGGVPVAALASLDPLTIRHNYDEHGYPQDPPYWQVMGGVSQYTSSPTRDPTPLQDDQLAVLRYPKGNRSYRRYPISASWQVKEWLEILADSVTHHKRYYSDNEVPPGLMQVVDASTNTIEDIQNQIEQASGDPRDFPIVGGEAPANWVEMGGTAINLDVISEQEWFFQMCLMSLGLNKAEFGMVEDVNYSNGEVQADMIYKKVGQPFAKQFEEAFMHIARQFDVFTELGEPFTPTIAHSDPKAERAKQERLRQEYEAGKITLRQYVRRAGDPEIADDEDAFTVTLDGETIDYGKHPKWVAQRLLSAAGATEPDAEPTVGGDGETESDGEGE